MNTPQAPIELTAHLLGRAADYFDDLRRGPVEISTVACQTRPRSRIYRFRLSAGGRTHGIVVKEPRALPATPTADRSTTVLERPRLVLRADAGTRYKAEYAGLLKVETELPRDDGRFGVVRALDFVANRSALVMAELREPTLRDLLIRHMRLKLLRQHAELAPAFRHAGAWLRHYHGMTAPEATARHATRRTVLDFAEAVGVYLGTMWHETAFFREILDSLSRAAVGTLPGSLPLVVSHGDFAPRNVFVGSGARVSVTDMSTRWKTAPYEDLAYFLTALHTPWVQALSQGQLFSERNLQEWEDSFIGGYYSGETPPIRAIQIYQLLMLLDKWAAQAHSGRALPFRRPSDHKAALISRWYRREATRLLSTL